MPGFVETADFTTRRRLTVAEVTYQRHRDLPTLIPWYADELARIEADDTAWIVAKLERIAPRAAALGHAGFWNPNVAWGLERALRCERAHLAASPTPPEDHSSLQGHAPACEV